MKGSVPVYAGSPGCGIFQGADGTTLRLEVGATLSLFFSKRLEIYTGLTAQSISLVMTADPLSPFRTFDPVSENEVELPRQFRRTLSWKRIGLDLIPRYHIAGPLSIGVGLSPGVQFGLDSRQTEKLTDNQGFTFEDGTKERALIGEEPLLPAPASLQLVGELGYRFTIASSLDFRIAGEVRYDILPPFQNEDLRGWEMGGRLGLSYHIPRPQQDSLPAIAEAPPAPVVNIAEENPPVHLTPPRRSNLSAEVDFYTTDETGGRRDTAVLLIDQVTTVEKNADAGTKEIREEEEVNPPTVQIDPGYQADAGLRRWEIVLRYNDSIIARHTSEDEGGESGQPDWRNISAEADSTPRRLSVTFRVEDSTGAEKTARAELPLLLLRNRRFVLHETGSVGEPERRLYSLPASLDTTESFLAELLSEVAENVREGSAIRVLTLPEAPSFYSAFISRRLSALLNEKGISEPAIESARLTTEETERLLRELPDVSPSSIPALLLLTNR